MKHYITIIFACSVFFIVSACSANKLEKGPSDGIIKDSINKYISIKEGSNGPGGDGWKIKNLTILNEFTLKEGGEKIYCYDVKCSYTPAGLEVPYIFPFSGVIKLVKRGDYWYHY